MNELRREIERRRTFAIISHPDAGKTTLTEKLLLYGGAIQSAGSVKGKQGDRHAVSDWMEIERQRGISVTSSVLQFAYGGKIINILDTPGHQDFSEDTYRTLMAADSAIMVIDAAKGIEPQTRKLFQVVSRRGIPIAALFIIARTWKQPRCPSADEWIRRLWYIYTMEYYSAIKKNTFESVLMRWMKLEPIIQSEVSQKEKHQYSILTHIYGI